MTSNLSQWLAQFVPKRFQSFGQECRCRRLGSGRLTSLSPASELLEDRILLATIVWDGEAGDGIWNSAANWFDETNNINDVLPGAGDAVEIRAEFAGDLITISSSAAADSVISAANLRLATGAFDSFTIGDDAADVSRIDGSFTYQGGRFRGAGTFITAGAMLWTHGDLFHNNVRVEGRLEMSEFNPFVHKIIKNGGQLTNVGVDTGIWIGGILDLEQNGVFINAGDLSIETDANLGNNPSPGVVRNLAGATIIKTGTTGEQNVTTDVNNDGRIIIASGTFEVSRGNSDGEEDDGVWEVQAPGTLEFGPTQFDVRTLSAASTVTGDGHLRYGGNTVVVNGTYTHNGLTTIESNGQVSFNVPVVLSDLVQESGTLTGSGSLVQITGTYDWHGGEIRHSNVRVDGRLAISELNPFVARILTSSGQLTNNGTETGTWTGGNFFNIQGTFVNAGDLLIETDGDLSSSGNSGLFRNLAGATITKTTTTGTQTILTMFDNDGTVIVEQGTLEISIGNSDGEEDDGIWDVRGDGTIEFGPTSFNTRTFSGASTVTGDGHIVYGGTTVAVNGTYTHSGLTTIEDTGRVSFNVPVVLTDLFQESGRLMGGGSRVQITGTYDWQGGEIWHGNVRVDGRLVISAIPFVSKVIKSGAKLTNAGAETGTFIGDGFFLIEQNGIFENAGDLLIETDGTISGPGGLLRNLAGATMTKTGTTGTQSFNGSFENDGTLSVESGTLILRNAQANFSSSGPFALERGRWIVSTADPLVTNATILIDGVSPITVNRADILLDGAGAAFRANIGGSPELLSSLRTNDVDGILTIQNGYDLSPSPGNLQNDGTLTIGPASTLAVTGDFNQSFAARLAIGLGDAPATGEFGRLTATGDANLDGTFAINLEDGFGPTTGQTFEVITFANRNGGFSNFEGLFLGATQAFEVVENPDNVVINALADASDLAVDPSSIMIGGSGVVGEEVTIEYTVNNLSETAASGDWIDSVYLSSDLVLDPFDVLLGRVTHTGGVAGLGSYSETLAAPLPGVLPGNYRVFIVQDSRGLVPDQNRADNTALAPPVLTAQFTPLPVGGSVVGTIDAGENLFYQLDVPPASDVLLAAQLDLPGGVEIYVRFGQIPNLAQFDHFESSAETAQPNLLLSESAGRYYVLVRGRDDLSGGPRNFELAAIPLGLTTNAISPGFGSNAGSATTTINGSGFSNVTTVKLRDGFGGERAASGVTFSNSNRLFATFDLTGLSPGAYDVVVENAGDSAVLAGAFTVTDGEAGQLETTLTVGERALYRFASKLTIEYANTGQTDIRAPLLEVRALTPDVFLRLDSGDEFRSDVVQFLGIDRAGLAGVLSPGASFVRELEFFADGQTLNGDASFAIRVIDDPDEVINWDLFRDELKPPSFADDAWDVIFARFVALMDTNEDGMSTLGEYEQVLADAATYLSELGEYTDSVPRLIGYLSGLANNQYPNLTLTRSIDAQAPAAGMPLTFQRAFLQPISRRFQTGPFGRGWTSSWDWRTETNDVTGIVTIGTLSGTREFRPTGGGDYLGVGGGELTRDGTEYFLREPNGDLFTFDVTTGLLIEVADRNGNAITLGYSGGQLTELTHTNGDRFLLEYANGRIVKLTDHADRETTYSYDPSNQYLLSVTGPDGTTEYTYETANGLAAHALLSIIRPDQTATFFEYDEFGRLLARMENAGQDRATLEYGDLTEPGRITMTDTATGAATTYLLDDAANIIAVTNPGGESQQFDYDEFSRITGTALTGNLDYRVNYNDDDSSATLVDPLGLPVVVQFDPATGELVLHEDELNRQTEFDLDVSGNLVTMTYADGSQELLTFDSQGNIASHTNRRGQRIDFTYNARGQVLREAHADGSFREFTYDDRGNMTSATDALGTILLTYDSADRLTRIEYPDGRFLAYDRDAGGRITRITDADGFEVNYSFDAAGRLSQLTDANGDALVIYTYDDSGRQTRQDNSNGTFTTFEYNLNGDVTRIAHHAPDGSVNSSYQYAYDQLGRRTSSTTEAGTTTYGYDFRGQLTSVTRPDGRVIQYEYDPVGRRLAVIDDGVVTNYVSNELRQYAQVGSAQHFYDSDGNLIRVEDGGQTTTYEYDNRNRLIRVEDDANVWIYEYNALGQRVASTANGVRTEYVVDPLGLGNVAAEYDDAGNLVSRYLHTDDGPLAQILPAEDPFYYDFDAIGSIVALTDADGSPVNQYDYLPFGELAASTETVANPYTFVGALGVRTDPTGLSFMRNRYYQAGIGSFLSVDPLRVPPVEPYGYAGNNPVQRVDPLGLNPFLRSLGERRRALEDLADFGEDGIDGDRLNAVQCAGESVLDNAGDFGEDLATNLSLPLPNPLTVVSIALGLDGLFEMGREVERSRGSDDGSGGGEDGDGSSGPGSGGGGGGGACCGGCGGSGPGGGGNGGSGDTSIVGSFDPNDIIGPAGVGDDRHLLPGMTLPYTIRFENLDSATAPARGVTITQVLDDDLDLSTFELGDFGFGGLVIDVPAGRNVYSTRIDLTASAGVLVDVSAGVNLATGTLTWTFTSLDPTTLDLSSDPFLGFLPPNQTSPEGEGFVEYSIRSRSDLTTGTQIEAEASIVFDANDPIETPLFLNTIDAGPPTSSVDALPAETFSQTFLVSWSGADDAGGVGIANYDLFVSEDGGDFELLLEGTTETQTTFSGNFGSTYGFYVVATDFLNHQETPPAEAQATTTLLDTEPEDNNIYIVASGPGISPSVKVYRAETNDLLFDLVPYELGFLGGVRVAAGDVNGDGTPDIITAAGPGGGPHVKVFDGITGESIRSFFTYDSDFTGGVFVASADVDGDGNADIITGADAGGGPHVRVLSGNDGSELTSFFAFDADFRGGVRVAAGDISGNGVPDVVAGAGPGGGPHVRVFDSATSGQIDGPLGSFFAYEDGFTGGVFVTTGDLTNDGRVDLVTGAGEGGPPLVRAWDGGAPSLSIAREFFAYESAFLGGVRVAVADVNRDGRFDLITGAGKGGGPHLVARDLIDLTPIFSEFPYDPEFPGGIFVASSADHASDEIERAASAPSISDSAELDQLFADESLLGELLR